jgi:hypothetical protein
MILFFFVVLIEIAYGNCFDFTTKGRQQRRKLRWKYRMGPEYVAALFPKP